MFLMKNEQEHRSAAGLKHAFKCHRLQSHRSSASCKHEKLRRSTTNAPDLGLHLGNASKTSRKNTQRPLRIRTTRLLNQAAVVIPLTEMFVKTLTWFVHQPRLSQGPRNPANHTLSRCYPTQKSY